MKLCNRLFSYKLEHDASHLTDLSLHSEPCELKQCKRNERTKLPPVATKYRCTTTSHCFNVEVQHAMMLSTTGALRSSCKCACLGLRWSPGLMTAITNYITYTSKCDWVASRTLHKSNWITPVKPTCPCQTLSAHSYIFRSTVQAGMPVPTAQSAMLQNSMRTPAKSCRSMHGQSLQHRARQNSVFKRSFLIGSHFPLDGKQLGILGPTRIRHHRLKGRACTKPATPLSIGPAYLVPRAKWHPSQNHLETMQVQSGQRWSCQLRVKLGKPEFSQHLITNTGRASDKRDHRILIRQLTKDSQTLTSRESAMTFRCDAIVSFATTSSVMCFHATNQIAQ